MRNTERLFQVLSSIHPLSDEFKLAIQSEAEYNFLPKNYVLLETPNISDFVHFLIRGFAVSYTFRGSKKYIEWIWKDDQIILSPKSFFERVPSLMLHYDKEIARLIYLYFYRNEFMVIDTNLNLTMSGHTIDTNSRAKIEVRDITSEKTTTISSPPLLVNRRSSASGKYLFVNSALQANNEQSAVVNTSTVFDVYRLTDGEYEFSFYLPEINNKKLKNFRVFNDLLVTIYDNQLITYTLSPFYFKLE